MERIYLKCTVALIAFALGMASAYLANGSYRYAEDEAEEAEPNTYECYSNGVVWYSAEDMEGADVETQEMIFEGRDMSKYDVAGYVGGCYSWDEAEKRM